MRSIHCSPWAPLVVVLLADAAPAPSCGGTRESNGYLEIGLSDCECAPGQIWVSVDGSRYHASCGREKALNLWMSSGTHAVSAASETASWPERNCSVQSDATTRIDLGCPSDVVEQCAP